MDLKWLIPFYSQVVKTHKEISIEVEGVIDVRRLSIRPIFLPFFLCIWVKIIFVLHSEHRNEIQEFNRVLSAAVIMVCLPLAWWHINNWAYNPGNRPLVVRSIMEIVDDG